jgi:hypothetical protein
MWTTEGAVASTRSAVLSTGAEVGNAVGKVIGVGVGGIVKGVGVSGMAIGVGVGCGVAVGCGVGCGTGRTVDGSEAGLLQATSARLTAMIPKKKGQRWFNSFSRSQSKKLCS